MKAPFLFPVCIFLVGFIFLVAPAHAQKIDKYCEVFCDYKGLSTRLIPKLALGEVDSLSSYKDTSIRQMLIKVESVHTRVDILNYMASIGWTLVFITPNSFIFKKSFDRSEMQVGSY